VATGRITNQCAQRHGHREFLDFLKLVVGAYPRRVQELIAAIRQFCHGWNQRCQLFTWTKDADQILAKLNRQATSTTTR
jgi:hypothetical protein